MKKNPISVETFLNIATVLPPSTSVLLRGPHGIGKSEVARQISGLWAIELGVDNYHFIDRRLSQTSEGDLIGLPKVDDDSTKFLPVDWYVKLCEEPGFLFLDEINRASPEVMQAAFQIVLDRELNGHKLHPQTVVYAAINNSAEYTVNEMDPALLDRFWVVDLMPTVKDWLSWAKASKIHPTVIGFIADSPKLLDPPKNYEPGDVHPSRRSWARVSKAIERWEETTGLHKGGNLNFDLLYPVVMGFCGVDAAVNFIQYAKTVESTVSPEEVFETYGTNPKLREKISLFTQSMILALNEKCIDYGREKYSGSEKPTGKVVKSISRFMAELPAELRISFWSAFSTKLSKDNLLLFHEGCKEIIVKTLTGSA